MNSVETKKAKRRKTKGTVVKPTTSSNDSSRENLPKSLMDFPQDESDKEVKRFYVNLNDWHDWSVSVIPVDVICVENVQLAKCVSGIPEMFMFKSWS